jgi:SAM-dependent methyltransferase
VVATDASARQIEEAHPLENVRFAVAPAESSGLRDASVDLVTVAQALHWFDLPAFFGELRRVLVPRGVFAAWCYGLLTMAPEIDSVLNRFYRDVVGEYWPEERAIVERGYASIEFPSGFDEIFPPAFRMEKHWTLAELLGYVRTWSAVRRYAQARRGDPLVDADLERELAEPWGPPGTARKAMWDLDLRMGRRVGGKR